MDVYLASSEGDQFHLATFVAAFPNWVDFTISGDGAKAGFLFRCANQLLWCQGSSFTEGPTIDAAHEKHELTIPAIS
jgi:hypothetical protein